MRLLIRYETISVLKRNERNHMKLKKMLLSGLPYAEKIIVMSADDAANKYENLAQRIIVACLNYRGWYAANFSGVKTVIVTPEVAKKLSIEAK